MIFINFDEQNNCLFKYSDKNKNKSPSEAKAKPVGFTPISKPRPCMIFIIPININIKDRNNKTISRKPKEANPVTLLTGLTISLLKVSSKLSKDSI